MAAGVSACGLEDTAARRSPLAAVPGLRQVVQGALSLLAPSECRLCCSPLTAVRAFPVCEDCINRLRSAALGPTCDRCGDLLPPDAMSFENFHPKSASVCTLCAGESPRFVRATAFGPYDELRAAIQLMKFDGEPALASPLGKMLAAAILAHRPGAPDALAVVPVPLFRGKRGFNQSTLLARSALRVVRHVDPQWELTLRPDLLRRVRRTESQFLLSPVQRRANLRGAFACTADLEGLHVLLIDDVYTTGATAGECTRTMLAAGAASVRVATLARAVRHLAARWCTPVEPEHSSGSAAAPRMTGT